MDKNITKTTVILFGICAIIWAVKAIIETINQAYNNDMIMYFLDVGVALAWTFATISSYKKYKNNKK